MSSISHSDIKNPLDFVKKLYVHTYAKLSYYFCRKTTQAETWLLRIEPLTTKKFRFLHLGLFSSFTHQMLDRNCNNKVSL